MNLSAIFSQFVSEKTTAKFSRSIDFFLRSMNWRKSVITFGKILVWLFFFCLNKLKLCTWNSHDLWLMYSIKRCGFFLTDFVFFFRLFWREIRIQFFHFEFEIERSCVVYKCYSIIIIVYLSIISIFFRAVVHWASNIGFYY